MNNRALICTDLDRTLIPNGEQAESPQARDYFRRLAALPQVHIAYVTGRHRELVLEAIQEYQLPVPNYVLGDVGTSIYECSKDNWKLWQGWQDEIAKDWCGFKHQDLEDFLTEFDTLRPQESEKQNRYKLSYYAPEQTEIDKLLPAMQDKLNQHGIRASLIWSIDDLEHLGLLDVLPLNATKLHAIEFLMQEKHYAWERTLFAGDSGNDLPVLASRIRAVLVANAREDVRLQAMKMAKRNQALDSLYIAKGGYAGMNGNYSAGILEGVYHYMPELADSIF